MVGNNPTCFKEMAEGKVDPATVEKIIDGSEANNEEEMEKTITFFRETYWQGYEDEAERIYRQFHAEGKIFYSRITEGWAPYNSEKIWFMPGDQLRRVVWSQVRYINISPLKI